MFSFQEIKKWAKQQGYNTIKEEDGYYWTKNNNIESSGVSKSVSKLARDIFNHITNNKWIDYQAEYLKTITKEIDFKSLQGYQ